MTKQWRFGVFLCAAFAALHSAGKAQTDITFAVHPSVDPDLIDAQADNILSNGKSVLADIDGPGDVNCVINLKRINVVDVLMGVSGKINSPESLSEAISHPKNVKIVYMITWCGGVPIGSGVLGCSPHGSTRVSLVVVRPAASLEGTLWMHEYGHNCGLPDNSSSDHVMHRRLLSTSKKVTPTESSRFTGGPTISGLQHENKVLEESIPSIVCDDKIEEVDRAVKLEKVDQFVRYIYFHGLPYEETVKFGGDDVPTLVRMLGDPKEEKYWPNIVTTLGFIGDGRAGGPLIEFFKTGKGRLSRDAYQAKNAVLIHLGDLINRSNHQAALRFLIESALANEPWSKRVEWSRPLLKGEKNQDDELLTSSAVWGLAMSGKPEALRALTTLQAKKNLAKDMKQIVKEAIRINKEVAKVGVRKFRLDASREAKH